MKVIGILQALAGAYGAPEEIAPIGNTALRDVVEFFVKRYKFAIPPNVANTQDVTHLFPPILFRGGSVELEGETINVGHLTISSEQVSVAAVSSEAAKRIVDDAMEAMNESLGFRFTPKNTRWRYLTNMVVDFEKGLIDRLPAILEMNKLIDEVMPKADGGEKQTGFKRVAFGRFAPDYGTWEEINSSSFSIERRVGHPFSDNRYFCAAPIPSEQLISTLEAIERILDKFSN